MLPVILTCSCPSSAAALPRRSSANWESCSAYCGLPTHGKNWGDVTHDGRAGYRTPVAGLEEQNRGRRGLFPKRDWLDGRPLSSPRRCGVQLPQARGRAAFASALRRGLGCPLSVLRPGPAFDAQRSLAEMRPSGRLSQTTHRHLAVSPGFAPIYPLPSAEKAEAEGLVRPESPSEPQTDTGLAP